MALQNEDALHVGFAVIIGVAVIGYFVGTGSPPEGAGPLVLPEHHEAVDGVPPARSYGELRERPPGDGAGLSADIARLASVSGAGGSKDQALADRAARRAYDGAPPTVPHPVRQSDASECLGCHQEGLRLRERLATPMPHAELASCTQCHVVSEAPMPGPRLPPDATFAANAFQGLASPTHGERAWDIAPPQIPHQGVMRERCMSCHGPNGRDALQSSHPERQSCTQCHAAAASDDLRPGVFAQGDP